MDHTVTLDKIKFGIQMMADPYLLDARAEILTDVLPSQMIIKLRGYLWGEDLPEKTISYPADWWQALKARWFPPWALKRWPVVRTVHHIKFSVYYPNFRVAMPKEKWRLNLSTWEETTPWYRHRDSDKYP